MTTSMTLGQKLTASISAMLLMLLALAASSLYSVHSLGTQFDNATGKTAKKLDISGSLATNSSEMLSFERAVLVCLNMKDLPKAESYNRSFEERASLVVEEIREIRPLLATDQGRRDTDSLQAAITSWSPAHQQLWRAGRSGQLSDALQIYDQQTLPLAKEMQRSANSLKDVQTIFLAEAVGNAHSEISLNREIDIFLSVVFLIAGGLVFLVVNRSSHALQRMTGHLGDCASQITSAAAQVASFSQSLAQGASEQASACEQTSASTEQITSMTRKNAENSSSAADVMSTVDQNIKEGNRTLEEMVVSMQEIKTSSDKISKIIKVIDEIAFQTNILALNAAVEAARAGEAGMGFAVVADEVRNLAQRSAQAAKDTAALIEDSIAKSGEGSAKLERVTQVIRAITESSAQVKTQVDEVNLGSQEQARGIDQISKAVEHINQVTQTTAASAEESASAGDQLSAQAESLRNVVSQLRTLVGSASQ